MPCVALETKLGDVVLFNHNTKHCAFGGSARRRMFTMNCCQRYPEAKLQELRDYMAGGARFWVEQAYAPAMRDTASPQRICTRGLVGGRSFSGKDPRGFGVCS